MRMERQRLVTTLAVMGLTLAGAGSGLGQERYDRPPPEPPGQYQTRPAQPTPEEQLGQPRYGRENEQLKAEGTSSHLKASKLIGKAVRNAQDENLGRVHDVIVDLSSGAAPYAIVAYGGALGIGSTKIAVPLSSLECSSDGKIIMSATRDEFQSASRTPTGAWAQITGDWTSDVDGFYGQPTPMVQERFERQPLQNTEPRDFVRDPIQEKGAEKLLPKPADADLNQKISTCLNEVRPGLSQTVQFSLDNGVVTLRGEVDTETEKQNIESKVTAIPGVQRVDNQLTVKGQ